jgi:hypothetical protein
MSPKTMKLANDPASEGATQMVATETKEAQEVKFTPGPWESTAETQQFDLGEPITIVAKAHPHVPIATVLNFDDFPCADDDDCERIDAEAQATARLIAAAPDLYEVAKAVADGNFNQAEVIQAARVAISKVKGMPR